MPPGQGRRPGNVLFGVDSDGRVSSLDVDDGAWKELPYLGVDFKRASAAKNFLWAVGGDHQVYVHLFGVEVPIRVKEELYENQRWNPLDGFSSHLLPTDRPKFSSGDGHEARTKDAVKLPTMAWQWESIWYVDTTFRGATLDKEGWTYAVDFPGDYYPAKTFTSCVRRRKWIRYRKYVATDSWSVVPGVEDDAAEAEPFIDVSVGGHQLPNGDPDELTVWAVTVMGRAFFRQGVTHRNPEGRGWLHVPVPDKCEVRQISVGPSGLVWATTWHGQALVRTGVTRTDPNGVGWTVVEAPPGADSHLAHVHVGADVVWALSRDRKVWIRNGVKGSAAGSNDSLAKGVKWVEMVGIMHSLCVGPNDQVFGVCDGDNDERAVVMRTGVSPCDPSGKTWKRITAVRTAAGRTVSSSSSGSGRLPLRNHHQEAGGGESVVDVGSSNSNFKRMGNRVARQVVANAAVAVAGATVIGGPLTMAARDVVADEVKDVKLFEESMYRSALEEPEPPAAAVGPDPAGEILDREDLYGGGVSSSSSSTRVQWLSLAAGSCAAVDPRQLPVRWFDQPSTAVGQNLAAGKSWRVNILQSLREKNLAVEEGEEFKNYEAAVERASWVRKTGCRVNFGRGGGGGGNRWENCTVELEQSGTCESDDVDFGTFSVFGSRNKEHLSLAEITAVVHAEETTLAVFTASKSQALAPILLKFNGDLEMEIWQAHLVAAVNSVRQIRPEPAAGSCVFSVTSKGEVLVFDAPSAENVGVGHNGFVQEIPCAGRLLPFAHLLENGFPAGSELHVSVRVNDTADQFHVNLQAGGNVVLHFNPRLNRGHVVLNAKTGNAWGMEEKQPLIVVLDDEDGSASNAFASGRVVSIVVRREPAHFVVRVNGRHFCRFNHRTAAGPEEVTHLLVDGDVRLQSIAYHSTSVIVTPRDMYWRVLGGGHLLQVESSTPGVTWGLSYDSTPWVHTGGWGGGHPKGAECSQMGIHPMEDSRYFYVYENQRWNPLTGFSSHGLPTDRCSWSDRSGRVPLTRDAVRLPSIRWQWTSDWLADYYAPGGVDREAWQYATDFPASFHGNLRFTDYVRRRRWARKARFVSSGPWKPLCSTKLIDVSMLSDAADGRIHAWAVAANGEALYRPGVSVRCPEGTDWVHVHSDVRFQSVTVGGGGDDVKVWTVGKDGSAFLRHGVTDVAPTGQIWIRTDPPSGCKLRCVSAGSVATLWAVDDNGRLYVRKGISKAFPEGISWSHVPIVSSANEFSSSTALVRSISATGRELWAVLDNVVPTPPTLQLWNNALGQSSVGGVVANGATTLANQYYGSGGPTDGVVARLRGVTESEPTGVGWDIVIGGGWKQVCARGR